MRTIIFSFTLLLCGFHSLDALAGNYYRQNGLLFSLNHDNKTAIFDSVDSTGIRTIALPSSLDIEGIAYRVTDIKYMAFSRCMALDTLIIPESITNISIAYFGIQSPSVIEVDERNPVYDSRNHCNAIIETATNTLIRGVLTTEIPADVTAIGDWAFSFLDTLPSFSIPEGITSVGFNAFSCCRSLASITLPQTLTRIGDGAFNNCSSLESIMIPDGVDSIGNGAFSGCSQLTDIRLPKALTTIGIRVFAECTSLTSVVLQDGITKIDNTAFQNCQKLTSIHFPNSLKEIGPSAFGGCKALAELDVPMSVESIGEKAFYGTAWESQQPDGMIYIGAVAYKYKGTMPANTSIQLPEYIKGITECLFRNCEGLTDITLSDGITSIPYLTFSGCTNLKSITNTDHLNFIGASAFENCKSLTEIPLPKHLSKIESGVFSGCSSLTSIVLPDSLLSIEAYCFQNCSSLENIIIPEKVAYIHVEAFLSCTGLKEIHLPKELKLIHQGAFWDCPNVKDIFITCEVPPRYEDMAPYIPTQATLHVPAESVEAYKEANGWKWFSNIVSLTDGLINIDHDGALDKRHQQTFTLDGRTAPNPKHGVFIIRMDGYVRKVIIP